MPGRSRALLVLALGTLLLWGTVSITVNGVFARRSPDIALLADPWSAEARVRRAEAILIAHPDAAGSPVILALATEALMREPVNAAAARLLGLATSAKGQPRAIMAMRYALLLSRRDLLTHLWFIETSVARGDVAGALDHYDQALITSNRGNDILLPILSAAASDPAIALPLSQRLARRPRWTRLFLRQFIPIASSPNALVRLALSGGLADRPSLDAGLLQDAERRLVTLGGYRQAGMLYARANDVTDPAVQTLRDGGFETADGGEPFDWNLRNDPDLSAVRMNASDGSRGNALYVTAANGRGGDVASQLMLLAPGRYTITARVGGIAGDPLSYPQVIVRCDRSNVEFLHARLPSSVVSGSNWQTMFDVPASCRGQWLTVQVTSPLEPQQQQPWIDAIAIRASGAR